jgi:acetyltransferase-like isoleucine patch superfamily enzyme
MVIADPCTATEDVESIFTEVLGGVLRVDRVSVDSHFFDELGADSLVMAHFCARVRKRGGLPSVSMQDVYGHPTIRSLAAALADAAPPTSAKPSAPAAIEVFNQLSRIQGHSLEDGTFKSDHSTLGAGVTIGVGAVVHYGVTMGDGSSLAADSFLMKGEYVPAHARWGGNPAREL